MAEHDPNVGIAWALTCGAGAATALGAAVVFVPSLVKLASKRVLAGGLGLSAGVMTYVSFVEIFKKSDVAFQNAGHDEGTAYALATGCFFCGVIFMIVSLHTRRDYRESIAFFNSSPRNIFSTSFDSC